MKRIVSIGMAIMIALTMFVGCSQIVSTEKTKVEATIVKTKYEEAWVEPVWYGKTQSFIHHSAKYEVIIEYDGIKVSYDNKEFYEQCANREGETVSCYLIVDLYDDGTTRRFLALED